MKSFVLAVALATVAMPAHAQLSTPNAAGVTYGHMHLTVADPEVHRKLFIDVFGGTLVTRGTTQLIKFPNMLIMFRQGTPSGPSQGTVLDHFGFKVKSMADTLAALRALNYPIQSEFTGAEGFPNAYVLAPDGLRLEVQEDKTLTVKAVPNHIHFLTPDFEKLLDWYASTFSAAKHPRGTIQTTADAGTVNMTFQTSAMPVVGTRGHVIDHIGFEVEDIDAFAKTLEAKGIKLDGPVRDVPALGLKIAFFTDPSGTYIELTQGLDKL